MCGRYVLKSPFRVIHDALAAFVAALELQAPVNGDVVARYNIAPQQDVLTLFEERGRVAAEFMNWGLVPGFAKSVEESIRPINARAETLREKVTYRGLYMRRRCLLPADGFYEWAKEGEGGKGGTGGKVKTPHLFGKRDGGVFAFAGLWDEWDGGGVGPLRTVTLITTAPNELVGRYHNRMPVMLDAGKWAAWMSAGTREEVLDGMLAPYPAEAMVEAAASRGVNKVGNEGAGLLRADEVRLEDQGLFG